MSDHLWIAYRDIEDYQPRPSFEILNPPGKDGLQVKGMVLPGMFGAKDIHIKWHTAKIEDTIINLVTYTHQALSARHVRRLLREAYTFAQGRRNKQEGN